MWILLILLFILLLSFLLKNDLISNTTTEHFEVPFKHAEPLFMQEMVPIGQSLTPNKMVETIYQEPLPSPEESQQPDSPPTMLYPTLPPPENSPGSSQDYRPVYSVDETQQAIERERKAYGAKNQEEYFEDWIPIFPHEGQQSVCILNHSHNPNGKSSVWKEACTYGVTNYPDPRTLSPFEQRLFKLNYSNQFTIQDYINWLWLYNDPHDQEALTYIHLRNLKRLQAGKQIDPYRVPQVSKKPPLAGADYYMSLYKQAADAPEKKVPMSYTLEQVSFMEDNYPSFLQSYQDYKEPLAKGRDLNSKDMLKKEDAKALDDFIYGVLFVEDNTLQARNKTYNVAD